jgi:rhodanese-related sulfurtransferase
MKAPRRFGLACAMWLLAAACAPSPRDQAPSGAPASAVPEKPTAQKPPALRRGDVSSIGFDEFFALHQQGKALVIDARPAYHYQLGHIPGALNLPKEAGESALESLQDHFKQAQAENRAIVVYCSGILCADARTVALRMARRGHDARIFSSGWNAWLDAGLPAE